MICAEGEAAEGTCYGDPGGPLQCEQDSVWILAGVTNPSCGTGIAPDIYARVSKFQNWIMENVNGTDIGFVTFTSDGEDKDSNFLCSGEDIDMDNSVNGTISYRQVTSGELLLAASNNLNRYFPNLNFTASWLFIATWDKVPYYNNPQLVNNNGHLTFEPFDESLPKAFPVNSSRDIIAPLWTKFDCSISGSISYHIVTQGCILDRARNDIKQYFPQLGFSVHTVFIATWNSLPYLNNPTTAGYDTINSTNYFSIPVPDENKLFNSSNVNVPGRWVFRVDGGPEEGIFYPYGDEEDEMNPQSDDGSSPPIPLLQPFVYFGRLYDNIFVNNNGDLTFDEPFSQYNPYYFPAYSTKDIIAPLWADINNNNEGTISYRQVTDALLLNRASRDINKYFPNINFSASWVFIATWDKVPYYINKEAESTFQVVLVSGKNLSFTLMHYDFITPIQSVESGFDTINSTNFISLPVMDIANLPYTSNVNIMGRWVFRVDHVTGHNGLFYPTGYQDSQNLCQSNGISTALDLQNPPSKLF
ncbi:uncharacterized protein LOC113112189 [Carassius auratus]|uniref:Uncharacterized protein LOC113112189 n=1 Tax=Carassius auratus TaxID=7957 RepID=A0A6P6QM90_CARAU|nr:uncharacterized protein LOC113112189 [Carassius auratus]